MAKYEVIHNPNNLVFKHEVWYSGKAAGQDSEGFRVERDVCKKVEAFVTQEKAEAYIKYQKDIRQFRGLQNA